ncbi:hypothetical protein E3P89_01648 [Wallemia ichthyophaga]|uniref:Glucosidase II subunit alpha n=1 Tax=Wallemia ichthyophaga TaxID=245174 RepID=A0A4T0ICE8_WALIC|nr:hypothetical protein E3P95_00412 [Wallemia ichthyophaga]TIB04978.1 hypothetical protein E3P94_00412 [Wallemia ichthyophaga]TIB13803.1 hypothetical protein E3P93_01800 [Wallemia ichthyophaga]TIB17048.1 hypothetical protein E3P90_00226 [Wallemia ichthyophaga]TIB23223.1 hypothetical protein E3P89_01648 [Wallemia ichthyophaga]
MRWSIVFLTLVLFLHTVAPVKQHDFKQCHQSSFCRRLRNGGDENTQSAYVLQSPATRLQPELATFAWSMKNLLAPPHVNFGLQVDILANGLPRLRIDEIGGIYQRYNQTASYVLIAEPDLMASSAVDVKSTRDTDVLCFRTSTHQQLEFTVQHNPLRLTLQNTATGETLVDINANDLLHMEHYRRRSDTDDTRVEGMWEETFNHKPDSKPKGPQAFSLDIDFPSHAHIYGIPEHAAPLALPPTDGTSPRRTPYVDNSPPYTEPYRLYNLDVFEYEASSPMALYGSVPLMHAHSSRSSLAVFLLSASEMWIDVKHPSNHSTSTQWMGESGIIDLFLIPGPSVEDVFAQYASLTGVVQLPQQFALGHHQCRWNYFTSKDMLGVVDGFDSIDAPVDVLWLDIEYAEGHKYFLWDKRKFPDPVDMIESIAATGRKTVNIIDPHLSRDENFYVYQEASDRGLLVKRPDGQSEYEGWCWAGASSWVDMLNPAAWDWWISLFSFEKWKDSTRNLFTWVDMNEPTVFNGPEITMPKDVLFHGNVEHRDIHNMNGLLFTNLTAQGLEKRGEVNERSFVLSRSFFAGSQRFGAVWTGDNLGTWEHLRSATPMNLANSISGIMLTGADVGGFFGDPSAQYLVRWYQTGAFHPFFRAHAHIDTKRREPHTLSEPYRSIVRDVLRLRYTLLPLWYTAFRSSTRNGMPVIRPQFLVHPGDEAGYDIDDQFYVGAAAELLVKPVVQEDAQSVGVYLGGDEPYYDYFTHQISFAKEHIHRTLNIPTQLDTLPLFIRGGSIIPTRERARRSASLMVRDPLTLTIALDHYGEAQGRVYLDDGHSFDYTRDAFIDRNFTFSSISSDVRGGWALRSTQLEPGMSFTEGEEIEIERIQVLGLKEKPEEVITSGQLLQFTWKEGVAASGGEEGRASLLTIKKPLVRVRDDFEIVG